MPFKCILLGVDGSKVSKKAATVAIDMASQAGSSILALYVIPVNPEAIEFYKMGKVKAALKEEGLQVIEQVKTEAIKRGVKHFDSIIEEGTPANKIVETAQDNGCDIIVLGTKGKSMIERLLIGSVAERVAGESSVPVLLVPGE